jgi:GntR family transcriptional regulator
MLIIVNAGDPRPVFRQIVEEVERCAATGILRPNDALPAVRELAKQLKVNPNTVQQAYRELERAGLAYVRRGVGTFVAQTIPASLPKRASIARDIANRFLREGFRHGLLASDLMQALREVAPDSAAQTRAYKD